MAEPTGGVTHSLSVSILRQADVVTGALAALAPPFHPPIDARIEWLHAFVWSCGVRAACFVGAAAALVGLFFCTLSCRGAAKRPARDMGCAVVLTVMLAYSGGFLLLHARARLQRPAEEIRRVASELEAVAEVVVSYLPRLLVAMGEVQQALPGCPERVISGYEAELQTVNNHHHQLAVNGDVLSSIINDLLAAASGVDLLVAGIVPIVCLPLAMVLVPCGALVYLVLMRRRYRRGGCLRCIGLALSLLAAPLIVALSVAELGVVLAGAAYCSDADVNTVALARGGPGDAAAAYYILGEGGDNPVLHAIDVATFRAYTQAAVTRLTLFDTVAINFCDNPLPFAQLSDVARSAGAPLLELRRLLDLETAYPLYDALVHDAACGACLQGLLGTALCHVAVGLLLLPRAVRLAQGCLDGACRQRKPRPFLAEMSRVPR